MSEFIDDSAERTEPATAKKREDTRRKGFVSKSAEMNSALIIVFGIFLLQVGSSGMVAEIISISRSVFSHVGQIQLTSSLISEYSISGLAVLALALGPILAGFLFIGLISSVAQVGFYFSTEALIPKWGKLNPFKGAKNILMSRRSLVEMLKNLVKVLIVGWMAYSTIASMLEESVSLMDGDAAGVLKFLVRSSLWAGLKIGLVYLVLAIFDYAYQRFEFEKEQMMTKEEVKEEGKMQEGNPLIKGRIRSIQRQIAYKRMMQDVPKADVVVTNPTHVAVAIKYDSEKMNAPRVVAKGAELIAQRIKKIAAEHNIPIVEDKVLARTLFKAVDIGEEIPEKLFQAIAQLLAYIYRMKKVQPGYHRN